MTKHAVGRETRPKSPVTLGGPKQAARTAPPHLGAGRGDRGHCHPPWPRAGRGLFPGAVPISLSVVALSAAAAESGTCGSHGARSPDARPAGPSRGRPGARPGPHITGGRRSHVPTEGAVPSFTLRGGDNCHSNDAGREAPGLSSEGRGRAGLTPARAPATCDL